jgi:hypothetical protein
MSVTIQIPAASPGRRRFTVEQRAALLAAASENGHVRDLAKRSPRLQYRGLTYCLRWRGLDSGIECHAHPLASFAVQGLTHCRDRLRHSMPCDACVWCVWAPRGWYCLNTPRENTPSSTTR